jgi:hypothetical protein
MCRSLSCTFRMLFLKPQEVIITETSLDPQVISGRVEETFGEGKLPL